MANPQSFHVFTPDHNLFCTVCGYGELAGDHGMIPGDGGASGTDFSPQYANDAVREEYSEQLGGLSEFEDGRPDWPLREYLQDESEASNG